MKRFLFINLILFWAAAVFAQSKLSPNTWHLVNTLKQTELKAENKGDMFKNYAIRKVGNVEYINAYLYLTDHHSSLADLEKQGVKINSVFTGIVTASVPVNKLEEIARMDDVRYIQVGSPVRQTMNKARLSTLADEVQSGLGLPGAFWGTGVVVGVIDTGLEYGHVNFYNFDKTDLRLKRVWNQNGKTGSVPKGFSYGTEYKTQEEILAAKNDNSETHGTHVTGIAAGADTVGNAYYGMAGDADIVFVSMGTANDDPDNISVSDGMKYIYDYAASVNKPCVINLSLGMHEGPHDGTSTFDVLADQMQGEGKLLVGACGNEGSDNFHLSKTFTASSQDSLSSFIYYPAGIKIGMVDIWGEPGMKYTIQLYIYDRGKKTIKKYFDKLDASSAEGNEKTYSLRSQSDGVQGYISFVSEISPLNDKPHVGIMTQFSSMDSYYAIGFTIRAQSAGTVHAWADDVYAELTNNNIDGYTKGNSQYSVGEIGGTGKRIISVGAYTSKNDYEDFNGTAHYTSQKLNDITSFSSLGPTADGRIKPDVTAPGSAVASSISNYDKSLRSEIIANKKVWNNKTYYYGMMDGTSMASPCVTGILATWLQANGELTPEDVRSILQKTSIRDTYTGDLSGGPDNTWGYGKINAYEGIKESLRLNPAGITSQTVPAVLFESNGNNGLKLLFTTPIANTVVFVYDVNGKAVFSKQIGRAGAGQETELSIDGLDSGIYIVKIAGDQVAQTSKVVIR